MAAPCIVIIRHQPGIYEWAVMYDQEPLDGDVGLSSIEECLSSALGSIPAEERLVEVRYRGMHMGSFNKLRIEDCADEMAAVIAETYGLLTQPN